MCASCAAQVPAVVEKFTTRCVCMVLRMPGLRKICYNKIVNLFGVKMPLDPSGGEKEVNIFFPPFFSSKRRQHLVNSK